MTELIFVVVLGAYLVSFISSIFMELDRYLFGDGFLTSFIYFRRTDISLSFFVMSICCIDLKSLT